MTPGKHAYQETSVSEPEPGTPAPHLTVRFWNLCPVVVRCAMKRALERSVTFSWYHCWCFKLHHAQIRIFAVEQQASKLGRTRVRVRMYAGWQARTHVQAHVPAYLCPASSEMDAGQCKFHQRTLCRCVCPMGWNRSSHPFSTLSVLRSTIPRSAAICSERKKVGAPPTGRSVTEAQSLVTAKLNRLCEAQYRPEARSTLRPLRGQVRSVQNCIQHNPGAFLRTPVSSASSPRFSSYFQTPWFLFGHPTASQVLPGVLSLCLLGWAADTPAVSGAARCDARPSHPSSSSWISEHRTVSAQSQAWPRPGEKASNECIHISFPGLGKWPDLQSDKHNAEMYSRLEGVNVREGVYVPLGPLGSTVRSGHSPIVSATIQFLAAGPWPDWKPLVPDRLCIPQRPERPAYARSLRCLRLLRG